MNKTKMFEVTVVAEVSVSTVITVAAASLEDAEADAQDKALDLDFDDWDMGQLGRIEVDHTEETTRTPYIVLYKSEYCAPADPPLRFLCAHADDTDHAEEQCLDAEPNADIVWVVNTADPMVAMADYWDTDRYDFQKETT